MTLAEGCEIGHGRKTILHGYGGQVLVGGTQLVENILGTAGNEPLLGSAGKFSLETTLETTYGHVGERCEIGHVADLLVVLVYEIAKIAYAVDGRVEQGVQRLLGIVGPEQNEKLLPFDFVEVDALQTLFEIGYEVPEKLSYMLVIRYLRKCGGVGRRPELFERISCCRSSRS